MADSDLLRVYHDLPISSFSGWSKVWQIEGILASHDRGYFRESSTLCDAMMRDDRIAAVSDTRVSALIASPVECKPSNPSSKALKAAQELGGDGEFPGLWQTMFPSATIGELSWWGNWLGVGIAQILWDTTGTGNVPSTAWQSTRGAPWNVGAQGARPDAIAPPGAYKFKPQKRWTPHLKVWHPQYVYWDWATSRYVALCQEGAVVLPNTDEQLHSDGKWFIWTPKGYQYGWLKSMVRRIAHKYIMRGWNYRDWARYNERTGQPILGAIMPATASDEAKKKFKQSLIDMANEAVLPLQQGAKDEGNSYDLKLIEATARTYQSFALFKKELDDDIAISFLGQNLTTDAQGGSYALGQVQDKVRIDKRIEDAGIDVAIRNQILWWDAGYNYGDSELAPIPEHQVEPPEDESEEAKTMLAVGQALTALATGAPDQLDVRAVLDRFGMPMQSEEQVAAAKQEREDKAKEIADQAAAAAGAQGGEKKPGAAPFGKPPAKLSAVPAAIAKRFNFQGLDIAIENAAGSERHWTAKRDDGTELLGKTLMLHDYGFIEGVLSGDGEELDCYVGPDETARFAYVVHQKLAPDFEKHDEDKVMLGFASADAATAAYLAHRNDGDRAFGSMSVIPMDRFKAQLRRRPAGATSKIRATAATAKLMALAESLQRAKALRAGRSAKGSARAARYADTLEANGVREAGKIIAGDLHGLMTDIQAASGYEDLRDRVIARYREKMKPEALAELIKRVGLMAHLAGRYTAQKVIGGPSK